MPPLTLVSEQKRLRRELKNTVVGLKEVLREIWQFFNSVTSGQTSKRSQNTAVERVRTQHKFLMHHLSMFNQQKDRFTDVCDEAFYDVEEPRYVHVMQYFDSIEEFVLDFDNRRERSCRAAVAKLVKEREFIQEMFQKLTKALNAFVLQFELFLKQDRFKEYVQGLIAERGTSKRKRRIVYDDYDEENYDDGNSVAATSGDVDLSLSKYEDAAQERSQRMAEEAERDGVVLGNRVMRKRRFTRVDLYEYGNECRELPDDNKESDDDEDDESVEVPDDDDDDDDDDTISDDDEEDDDEDEEDEKEDDKFDDKAFHKADDVLLNGESSSDDEESGNENESDDEARSVAESDIDNVSADDLDAEIEGDDCGSTSSEQQSDQGSGDGSDAS